MSMKTWLRNVWNAQWAAAELANLRTALSSERQLSLDQSKAITELQRERNSVNAARDDLEHRLERAERYSAQLEKTHEGAGKRIGDLRFDKLERDQLKKKLAAQAPYFAEFPAANGEEAWSKDDATALAHFLEKNPAGKKLAQHLNNRLHDYQAAAIQMGVPTQAYALLARARGFRDARGEIARLSAAGPSPANHVETDPALPSDLENLRA